MFDIPYGLRPVKNSTGAVMPFEYYETKDMLAVGMPCYFKNGGLTAYTGTEMPGLICMANQLEHIGEDNEPVTVPVVRVTEDTIFETKMGTDEAQSADLDVGVTISIEDDCTISANESGKLQIISMDLEDDIVTFQIAACVAPGTK